MVRHSTEYRKLVADGLEPGRFLNISAGEWLSGLPAGWTCPQPGSVDPACVQLLLPSTGPDEAALALSSVQIVQLMLHFKSWVLGRHPNSSASAYSVDVLDWN